MFYLKVDNYNILRQHALKKIKSVNNIELKPAIN